MDNKTLETKNYFYDKIIQIIEGFSLSPVSNFNISKLKNCKNFEKLSREEQQNIKVILNNATNTYINFVKSSIKEFLEKYKLKEKLEIPSEVYALTRILDKLQISLDDLVKLEDLNSLQLIENDELNLLKYYSNIFINKNNIELEEENAKLREELKMIRAKNQLGIN